MKKSAAEEIMEIMASVLEREGSIFSKPPLTLMEFKSKADEIAKNKDLDGLYELEKEVKRVPDQDAAKAYWKQTLNKISGSGPRY